MSIHIETLRLFKSIPIELVDIDNFNSVDIHLDGCFDNYNVDSYLDMRNELSRGYFITDALRNNCNNISDYYYDIDNMYGYNVKSLNSGFYKSFNEVANLSELKLRLDQMHHYITTYSAEMMGSYDKRTIYIPSSVVNLSEGAPLKITKIDGITVGDITNSIIQLISSGIALSEQSVRDIIKIISELNLQNLDLNLIKNREIKTFLYDFYDMVPEDPVEFLRFLVFKTTDQTLLIKNSELIDLIKLNNPASNLILYKYVKCHGMIPLSRIFFRYKPIFLAFKNKDNCTIINKIRKLADTNHIPLTPSILQNCSNLESIDYTELDIELKYATVFQKARAINSLRYRISNPTSILYKIRNGKAYATEYTSTINTSRLSDRCEYIYDSLVVSISKNVEGKKIYIPESITIAFPTSEKQFFGTIPYGSSISLGKSLVAGVHWFDIDDKRIDLDLHLINASEHFGWNSSYRGYGSDGGLYYSGDMTAAPIPNGASELYYIGEDVCNFSCLFNLNNYTYFSDYDNVNYHLIIDSGDDAKIYENDAEFSQELARYNQMISANTLIANIQNSLNSPYSIIGLIVSDSNGDKTFYFLDFSFGHSITPRLSEKSTRALDYLYNSTKTQLTLHDVLLNAGAMFVDRDECDVDLSIEALTKQSLMNLLT